MMDADSINSERLLELMFAAVPDDLPRFEQICRSVKDWDTLIHCALDSSLETFLYYALVKIGWNFPAELKERFERWTLIKDVWLAHSRSALDEILRALYSASIPAVVLKGPVLGERIYPNPSIRSSADLDVLVAPANLARATAVLGEIGYEPAAEPKARFLRKYHYHIMFNRACPPVLELHFNLSNGFGTVIPAEEFLSRAQTYRTSQGTAAGILSPEDELLYLSIHSAGHRFLRLSWLCDIKLLVRQHPDLNWEVVLARARSLKVLSAFLFTCERLQQTLAVRLPQLDRCGLRRIRLRVAQSLLSITARQPDPSRRSLIGQMAFGAVLCDSPFAAAEFMRRQLLLIVRRRAHRHFPSLTPEEWAY